MSSGGAALPGDGASSGGSTRPGSTSTPGGVDSAPAGDAIIGLATPGAPDGDGDPRAGSSAAGPRTPPRSMCGGGTPNAAMEFPLVSGSPSTRRSNSMGSGSVSATGIL